VKASEYEIMFRVEQTHWWYRAQHRLIFDTLERELPDWPEKAILDAGCGTGAILKQLGNEERNVGVDLAPTTPLLVKVHSTTTPLATATRRWGTVPVALLSQQVTLYASARMSQARM